MWFSTATQINTRHLRALGLHIRDMWGLGCEASLNPRGPRDPEIFGDCMKGGRGYLV